MGSTPIIRSSLLYDGYMTWLAPPGGEFKMIFMALSGTEYLVTLFSSLRVSDQAAPPSACWETQDGWVEIANGKRWPSLSHMAIEYGCIVGDFTSDDELLQTDN